MIRVAFVIGCTNSNLLEKTMESIVSLHMGNEFDVMCLPVLCADDSELIDAYEYGRSESEADWYVYISQDCEIVNKNLLFELKRIFDDDGNIGIIGILEEELESYNKIVWPEDFVPYYVVQAVNRAFVVSRVPIHWNSVMGHDDGVEFGYCFEAGKFGYDTVVVSCGEKWVLAKKLPINRSGSGFVNMQRRYADFCLHESLRKNYRYYSMLKQMIEKSTGPETLNLIKAAAFFATMNFSGVYSDNLLEEKLCDISNAELNGLTKRRCENGTVLHVMSEAYGTGGHTRVVLRWIKSDLEHKHSVALTFPKQAQPTPEWLTAAVKSSGGNVFHLTDEDDLDRAKALYELSSGYEKIVLHIHMWDVVPILAYSHRSWETPIYFMNHSSHTFWLGMGITDVFVLFLGNIYNQRFMKNRRGVSDTPMEWISLVHETGTKIDRKELNREKIRNDLGIEQDATVITSMATEWRYSKDQEYNFDRFVKNLIRKNNKCYVLLIGPLKESIRWQKLRMEVGGRCQALGFLPTDEVQKIFSITDVYVDSFIESSGGSLCDAIAYGLPVFFMRAYSIWLESFNCYTEEELLNRVLGYCENPDEYGAQQKKIQEWFNWYFSKELADSTRGRVYAHNDSHRMHDFMHVMPDCTDEDISTVRQFNKVMSLQWMEFLPVALKEEAARKLLDVYAKNKN